MDDSTDINSADAASGSDSSFWDSLGSGFGSALGAGLAGAASKAVDKKYTAAPIVQQTTPGVATTQQKAAITINPQYLIYGGIAVVGLFAVVMLLNARK